jgi:hypothetical protein
MSEETKTDTKPASGPPAPKVSPPSPQFLILCLHSPSQEEITCETLKKESKRSGNKSKHLNQIEPSTLMAILAQSTW